MKSYRSITHNTPPASESHVTVADVEAALAGAAMSVGPLRPAIWRYITRTHALVVPLYELDEIEAFYEAVMETKPNAVDSPLDKADPASKRIVYGGPGSFTPKVSLSFVHRTEKRHRAFSATWFQKYTVGVGRTYMKNYTDCWPIWGDNHVAVQLDHVDSEALSLDDAIANLNKIDWHLHHPFKGGCKAPGDCGPSDIYMMDPSGWTTQLVSPLGFGKKTLPGADVDPGGLDGYCYTFCEGATA